MYPSAGADPRPPLDQDISHENRACLDFDLGANTAERPYLHILGNPRVRRHDGSGVNAAHRFSRRDSRHSRASAIPAEVDSRETDELVDSP